MSDPRETPSNGRVAHVSLQGSVTAERYVSGEQVRVRTIFADLLNGPNGARERQLLRGEAFLALDMQDRHVFGQAEKDGYCGWLKVSDIDPLQDAPEPTHRVAARQTYAKRSAALKATEPPIFLSHGSRLTVLEDTDGWARIAWETHEMFTPSQHLAPLGSPEADPVNVALRFLGAPYLWGGNSCFGLDCSGLIQAAMLACRVPCPGDSDQQADRLGRALGPDDPPQRGDVYFWAGHVGLLSTPETLLHATAYAMAVVEEPLGKAIARIEASEGTPLLCRRRVTPPRG